MGQRSSIGGTWSRGGGCPRQGSGGRVPMVPSGKARWPCETSGWACRIEVTRGVWCTVLESIDLSREDCAELLRAGVIGRVAVSTPTGPHIVPVNYVVMDDAIIVRTTPYSLLGSHGRNA